MNETFNEESQRSSQDWFVYLFSTTFSSHSDMCCHYLGGYYFLRFRISSTRWTLLVCICITDADVHNLLVHTSGRVLNRIKNLS